MKEALAAVTAAEQRLADATAAIAANESALDDIRVTIKTLEASVPRVTFHDLIKQQCKDTAARRAGL